MDGKYLLTDVNPQIRLENNHLCPCFDKALKRKTEKSLTERGEVKTCNNKLDEEIGSNFSFANKTFSFFFLANKSLLFCK